MAATIEILIYRPGVAEPETRTIPKPSGYHEMKAAFAPILGDDCTDIEHVSVLFNGKPSDMFVDEFSAIDRPSRARLAVNEAATEIYHAASKALGLLKPRAPKIHGSAIVSRIRIWL